MKSKINKKKNPNLKKYNKNDSDIAFKFASEIYKEMGSYLKGIILFGSASRKAVNTGDIDILLVLDDISIDLSPEFIQTYRIIVEKLVAKISTKLHITTLKYTSFWEYVRNGDPVAINILRDGYPLIDTGFFEPLQALLYQGRIRPSAESIWTYFSRSPVTLNNAKWHILQATLDLYWAVIDASHAALMSIGEIPPTPAHVSDMVRDKLVKPKLLEAKYASIVAKFYDLSRMILHKDINYISGQEFDEYLKSAEDYIERMKEFVKNK
jgi:predicted nucleotidyltransferase